jgi:hypothetical protein
MVLLRHPLNTFRLALVLTEFCMTSNLKRHCRYSSDVGHGCDSEVESALHAVRAALVAVLFLRQMM